MSPIRLAWPIAILAVAFTPWPGRAADKPNIVYILADDLGYGDVGCYNAQSKIPTPALDRLGKQGMRFTDAHAPDAVCTPTRYGLLTGRYCFRSRLKRGVLVPWDPPRRMWAEQMFVSSRCVIRPAVAADAPACDRGESPP